MHFLNHPLGFSPQNDVRFILGRDVLFTTLWCSWLPVRSPGMWLLPLGSIPSWLSIVGVCNIPLEWLPKSFPAIWLARNVWNCFDNVSICKLIWSALVFCSPKMLPFILLINQRFLKIFPLKILHLFLKFLAVFLHIFQSVIFHHLDWILKL